MRFCVYFYSCIFPVFLVSLWGCNASKDASSSFRSEMQEERSLARFSFFVDSVSEAFFSSRLDDTWKSMYVREYYPWLDETGLPALKSEGWIDEGGSTTEESAAVANRGTLSATAEAESGTVSGSHDLVSDVKTETDSRLIQGSEFLWLALGLGIIIILFWFFYGRKN